MNKDCEHILDDGKLAIKIDLNKRCMVFPKIYYGVCILCSQSLKLDKDMKIIKE